jgi:muramoyltetrapeptide carboxypeptidase LdcA involved in peptidoglycan recycling
MPVTSTRKPFSVRASVRVRGASPASAALYRVPARAARGAEAPAELGFSVSYGRNARLVTEDGQTAGSAQQRAEDLQEAFAPAFAMILSGPRRFVSALILYADSRRPDEPLAGLSQM